MTLDLSGSYDPDGGGLTYAWTQTAGPTVTLKGAASPTFTAPSSADDDYVPTDGDGPPWGKLLRRGDHHRLHAAGHDVEHTGYLHAQRGKREQDRLSPVTGRAAVARGYAGGSHGRSGTRPAVTVLLREPVPSRTSGHDPLNSRLDHT